MEEQTNQSIDETLDRLLHRCGHFLFHQSVRGQRQDKVLHLLWKNGPMSQKAIQEQMDVQPGSISEMLSKLEGRGMLVRQRDPADRRRVRLSLTEKGMSWCQRYHEIPLEERYVCLSDEEKETLKRILGKLSDSWRNDK